MATLIYLRASTDDQNATRARAQLLKFAEEKGLLGTYMEYVENASGASLERPALMELLRNARKGDVLLVEQVDRLSRLDAYGWGYLKQTIANKQLRIVALDLPTSWIQASAELDEFTARMFDALNGMMLDMLAAIARKDYVDRKRRTQQGIDAAKARGAYKGRQPNKALWETVRTLKAAGKSYTEIHELTGAARTTIAKILKSEDSNGVDQVL